MLTVRLLGGLEVQHNGTRVEVLSRAAPALLAYLLLPAGEAHRRALLAGLLWPDPPEPNAPRSLRVALWQLRGPLERVGVRLLGADRLTVAADSLALHRLDVARLREPVSPWPSCGTHGRAARCTSWRGTRANFGMRYFRRMAAAC